MRLFQKQCYGQLLLLDSSEALHIYDIASSHCIAQTIFQMKSPIRLYASFYTQRSALLFEPVNLSLIS